MKHPIVFSASGGNVGRSRCVVADRVQIKTLRTKGSRPKRAARTRGGRKL